MADSSFPVVGGAQAIDVLAWTFVAVAMVRLQIERAEFVDAQAPAVGRPLPVQTLDRTVFLGKEWIGRFLPSLGPAQTHLVATQDFAQPADADVGHDLLLDQILTQFRHRSLGHANKSDGRREGDFCDVLANSGGEHAGGTYLKPGIPGDAVDAKFVKAMNDLPHPRYRAADHFRDGAIRAATDSEQNHAGIATV